MATFNNAGGECVSGAASHCPNLMGKHRRLLSLLAGATALLLESMVVHADVLEFSSKDQFTEATGALTIHIPGSEEVFPGTSCGIGFEPTGADFTENAEINIGFNFNSLVLRQDLTNPGNSARGLCIFDETFSDTGIDPSVMVANTIVGNGEDDYFIVFDVSVKAVGFRLLTNNVAKETIILYDRKGNAIDSINIDDLTPRNTRQFVGFESSTPIKSVLIDTENGWSQNEAIDEFSIADFCPMDPDNDLDEDGICAFDELGALDNCPDLANPDQIDTDADGDGDACDADDDNDTVLDAADNCSVVVNADQADLDRDGAGDACDDDSDGDGVIESDICVFTPIGEAVNAEGCAIADLCPCDNQWKNHGAYVSCVAHATQDFVDFGLITEAERDAIVSRAGQSQCGK